MPQVQQRSTPIRFSTALAMALTVVALLSSCSAGDQNTPPGANGSTPTPTASATPIEAGDGVPGTPADHGGTFEGTGPSTVFDPAAPDSLTVVLFGSSGCPPEPVSYTVDKDGKVEIATAYTGESEMCTKDYSPITYTIATPAEFDPNKGVALAASSADEGQ